MRSLATTATRVCGRLSATIVIGSITTSTTIILGGVMLQFFPDPSSRRSSHSVERASSGASIKDVGVVTRRGKSERHLRCGSRHTALTRPRGFRYIPASRLAFWDRDREQRAAKTCKCCRCSFSRRQSLNSQPLRGRILKRSTRADCKSAGLRLRRFESFSYHHPFLPSENSLFARFYRAIVSMG